MSGAQDKRTNNLLSGYPPDGPNSRPTDRFSMHSLPRESMKKVFGIETKHLGYVGQRSSFSPKKLVSTERNQPVGVFAGQGGPNPKLDRFQMHSIPKETMKKVFGIETKHLGFQSLKPTVRDNIGVGFGRSAKTTGSTNIEDIHWRQQVGNCANPDLEKAQ